MFCARAVSAPVHAAGADAVIKLIGDTCDTSPRVIDDLYVLVAATGTVISILVLLAATAYGVGAYTVLTVLRTALATGKLLSSADAAGPVGRRDKSPSRDTRVASDTAFRFTRCRCALVPSR